MVTRSVRTRAGALRRGFAVRSGGSVLNEMGGCWGCAERGGRRGAGVGLQMDFRKEEKRRWGGIYRAQRNCGGMELVNESGGVFIRRGVYHERDGGRAAEDFFM